MNLTSALLWTVAMSVVAALLVTALVAVARWRNRPLAARIEHALWLCVLAGMLGFAVPRITVYAGPPVAVPAVVDAGSVLVSAPTLNPTRVMPASTDWPEVWFFGWATVATLMILRIFVGMVLTRRSLTGARSILDAGAIQSLVEGRGGAIGGVDEADNVAVPMAIGWPFARIVLPTAWRTWPENTIRAVMLHELAHVERRDTLVAMLAAMNKAIFWFHPLAWWLERRLSELAEFAADDAAVRAAREAMDPRDYATVLVGIASIARPMRLHLSSTPASVDFAQEGVKRINRRVDRILEPYARFGSGKIVWAVAVVIAAVSLVQFERPLRAQGPAPAPAAEVRETASDQETRQREVERSRPEVLQAAGQPQERLDEAMKKLEDLARRQQELAAQQQTDAQRYQETVLRHEAERLRQELGQMTGEQTQQGIDEAMKKLEAVAYSVWQRTNHALAQLQQMESERNTVAQQETSQKADQMAAAMEKLRAVQSVLAEKDARRAAADLARTAGQLAERQQEFERQLRSDVGKGDADQKIADELAGQQEEMSELYAQLRKTLEDAIGRSTSEQGLTKQLRDALDQALRAEIGERMRISEQLLRQGMAQYGVMRSAAITQALNQLRDALKNIQ